MSNRIMWLDMYRLTHSLVFVLAPPSACSTLEMCPVGSIVILSVPHGASP